MSNRDGTGPGGQGPGTGGGRGGCFTENNPSGMKRPRDGRGRRFLGMFRGRRR